jgi:hypothetical protein
MAFRFELYIGAVEVLREDILILPFNFNFSLKSLFLFFQNRDFLLQNLYLLRICIGCVENFARITRITNYLRGLNVNLLNFN